MKGFKLPSLKGAIVIAAVAVIGIIAYRKINEASGGKLPAV